MGMNVLDTLYHTVHDYDGGAEALAQRLGKRGSSLCHEVRPPAGSTAKAGLLDAVKIMEISGDHRTLHVINAQLGYMAVRLPVLDQASEATISHLAAISREFNDVVQAAAIAAADGQITDNELASVQRQSGELIASVHSLLGDFVQQNAKGKRDAG
jgi:hypothetical protein